MVLKAQKQMQNAFFFVYVQNYYYLCRRLRNGSGSFFGPEYVSGVSFSIMPIKKREESYAKLWELSPIWDKLTAD